MKPIAQLLLLIIYLVGAVYTVIAALLHGTVVWLIRNILSRQVRAMQIYITVLPESYRRIIRMYDICGLRHNGKYLSEIKVRNQVAVMAIEKQCGYVDNVTRRMFPKKIRKKSLLSKFFPGVVPDAMNRPGMPYYQPVGPIFPMAFGEDPINVSALNTTAIGNIAWISLYHPDEGQRTKATELLADIREYFLKIITGG